MIQARRENREESTSASIQEPACGEGSVSGFPSQLGLILFLASIFFLNFISRIIMAPLMPTIEQDLNISHGQAGSLFLLVSMGYFPTLMGSGFVSSRLTHHKTILMSSATLGIALLVVAQCRSLWAIRAGLVILGLSAGFYLPSGIATLTSLINSRNWGKALAIHELAPNLSFLTAPLISEALLRWVSWRGILSLLGVVALLTGAAFSRFGKGGKFPGEAIAATTHPTAAQRLPIRHVAFAVSHLAFPIHQLPYRPQRVMVVISPDNTTILADAVNTYIKRE